MIEEKIKVFLDKLKAFGIFISLFIGYVAIPQIIGVIFYKGVNLSETLSMFIGNISFTLFLIFIYRKMLIEKIKDFIKNFGKYYGDSLKYWGIGLAVMFVSNLILAYVIFPGEIAANEDLNRNMIFSNPFIGVVSAGIIAPFVEEMIFRFALKKPFPKTKFFPLITALAFGLPHTFAGMSANASLVKNLLQLLYVIPYGSLGYAFGYVYSKSDNIFSSIIVHMTHNLMCCVIIFCAV